MCSLLMFGCYILSVKGVYYCTFYERNITRLYQMILYCVNVDDISFLQHRRLNILNSSIKIDVIFGRSIFN